MRLVSREVFARHENGRPPAAGFVTYADAVRPWQMMCLGREDYSDGYDDYEVRLSRDNGRTWGEPKPFASSYAAPGGRVRYAEPAAMFDAEAGRLVVLTYRMLYPDDELDTDAHSQIVMDTYDAAAATWAERRVLGPEEGGDLAVSFGFPIRTRGGEILAPAMRVVRDANGRAVHYRGCWSPLYEPVTLIGRWGPEGAIRWTPGQPAAIDPDRTSRGLSENTLAELHGGAIAMVARGDNSMFPDQPGCKWWCLSQDAGRTWSTPEPLGFSDGAAVESSSTGSALFRSIANGRLYWMGNLCPPGVRADGNWPRSPLVIAEVQEDPFALRRDTLTVVGDRGAGECEQVQHSNFRYVQDRENGDVVVYLTRYGERGADDWMLADHYRYRIAME